ncbi:hypothetical protein L7F22_036368 [Adiantum nelumboides]|nr:hypothetical protein [Adiantum nelumboides]
MGHMTVEMYTHESMYAHEDPIEYTEREKRSRNIVIRGMQEPEGETVMSLNVDVTNLLAEKLGMQDAGVYGAHTVGKKRTDAHSAVVCTMLDARKRTIILENARFYLKGTQYYDAISRIESPFYDTNQLPKNDPFADLCTDIVMYAREGVVVLLGDLNARIANTQVQLTDHSLHPADKNGELMLGSMWDRCSSDNIMNAQGSAMISMMNSMQLVAMNGADKFIHSGSYTCYTASHGRSTNDYALVRYDALDLVHRFEVGSRLPTSDHTPIHICIHMPSMPIVNTMNTPNWSYKMQLTKKEDYASLLDSLLFDRNMPCDIEETWKIFRHAMEEAARTIMGKYQSRKQIRKGLPHNPWFDAECKQAKRKMRGLSQHSNEWECAAKEYNTLTRKKRRMYELSKEQLDLSRFKKEPKKAWRNMKEKKGDVMGDFSLHEMYAYVQTLYAPTGTQEVIYTGLQAEHPKPITFQAIIKGLKSLANADTLHLNSEMLKWSGGDCNLLTNYRTIMVSSCMAKVFGSIIEKDLSTWAEYNGKRAIGQAGFRARHSTVDHLITLRVLMEEAKLKGKTLYCCFVDFKKEFDTVPRQGLWSRMETLGVPMHIRATVGRLYQEVRCKLKTNTGFSQEFRSTMGVKQGCPLSPTLFGLCIDELEDFINEVMRDGGDHPSIGTFTLLLLIYADDVVLLAYNALLLQKLMDTVHAFCNATGYGPISQCSQCSQCRNENQPIIMYDGQTLQAVESFKYLGIYVPSNHAWGNCVQNRIDAGQAKYYEFENMCKQSVTKRWEIKSMAFDACVVQTILYGVEVWGGGSIPAST